MVNVSAQLAHYSHPQPNMKHRKSTSVALLFIAVALSLTAGAVKADPNIAITPTQTIAGGVVLLQVRDFVPGGYDVSIQFDGVEIATWNVPTGGDGDTFILIPAGADPGGHDITVCAACDQGDLEQKATTRFTTVSDELADDEFNIQIQAIEVTQGLRGDIPARVPPGGSFFLPNDLGTHVANRRTVVRVYPWMEIGAGAPVAQYIHGELLVQRGASITGPYFARCWANADKTLEEMRGDPRYSLEFDLPADVVALSASEASFTLDFSPEITLVEGATETTTSDNVAELFGVDFEHVGLTNNYAFRFRPFLVENTAIYGGGVEITTTATISDMLTSVRSIHEILPIADGSRGLRLYPWRFVVYDGQLVVDGEERFETAMIRRFLPTGRLDGNPQNDYYAFLFETTTCNGHAYLDTPFFRANSCGAPNYTVAHELTHAIWQPHAGNGHGEAGGGGYDSLYPGTHGQVENEAFGYDVFNDIAYPPWGPTMPENQRHDFMSYGKDYWISRYSWDAAAADLGSPAIASRASSVAAPMLESLIAQPVEQQSGQYMLFTGTVDVIQQQFNIDPVFTVPPSQLGPATDLLFNFLDLNSNTLGQHWAKVFIGQDGGDGGILSEAILVPDGWTTLEIGDGQAVWDTHQRSANPPAVVIDNLSNGFQWGTPARTTGPVEVTWTAIDLDGDPLTYRVVGIRESTEMHVLASDLTATSVFIDPLEIPGGGNYEIFVEASDGMDSAWSQVVTGWVEPLPPQPLIVYPGEGDRVLNSLPLQAVALYSDFQDGDPQVPMQWMLDNVGVGNGDQITLGQLGLGPHTLMVTATNSFQKQGHFSVDFEVIDTLEPPALVAPLDGSLGEPLPPTLDWDAVAGASGYRLQVALDSAFTLVLVDDPSFVTTQFEFLAAYPTVTYYWRARASAGGEEGAWSAAWSLETNGSPVGTQPVSPRKLLNLRVFPNPFNPGTSISFSLPHGGPADLVIYDLKGRRVRVLLNETLGAGDHTRRWDGHNEQGNHVPSGVYVARVSALGMTDQRKMVLIK